MASVFFDRRRIVGRFSSRLPSRAPREIRRVLPAKRTRAFLYRVSIGAGVVLLYERNPALLLATLAGGGLMFGVYHLQEQDWRSLLRSAREVLSGSRLKLAIAALSGSGGALAAYLAVNIWTHTENRWLAIGSIAQGIGTLVTIALLGGHFLAGQTRHREEKIDRHVTALTSSDPLERLIAVRSLLSLDLPPERDESIREFFRYLLSRESDPAVRSALLDYFQGIEPLRSSRPLSIPLSVATETEKSLNFCHEFIDRC